MPNSFMLCRHGEEKPTAFAKIDDEMRAHFGVDPDPKKYFRNWYNAFSDLFALGKTWDEIRDLYANHYGAENRFFVEDIEPMLKWLKERYTISAWYSPR